MNRLKETIKNKSAVVGVIGLGYVGLPLAVEVAKKGFTVIGFENEVERTEKVNSSNNYIKDIPDSELSLVVKNGKLSATTDKSKLAKCDVILICVPTPLDKNKQPDMSYVRSAKQDIAKYIHRDMLIVLESTTYPGTTEEELKVEFEKSGMICGKDFFLAFSPERVDPDNKDYKTGNIPKVVGGITEECSKIAETFYKAILEGQIYKVSNSRTAEMVKLLENTYRNVNIALVNQFAELCHKMDINIWEVIQAAKTKPFGFHDFYPGPGVGGHCIPLDPYYLLWKAEQSGFDFSMISTSGQINEKMPGYIVEMAVELLDGNDVGNSKILISGIAYKANIDDYRESPALEIIKLLESKGANLHYYDPLVTKFKINERVYETENIDKELLENVDLVIVTTGHGAVDYEFMQRHAKLILDTRNALNEIKNRTNIVLL